LESQFHSWSLTSQKQQTQSKYKLTMKKQILLMTALGLVSAASVQAQGAFNFSNYAPGVNSPITFGGSPVGSTFMADALWGAAGVTDPASLQPLNYNVAFSGGGYFLGGARAIAGQTGIITLQIVAWRISDGASYAAAKANGGVVGAGNLLQIPLAVPPAPAPNLIGLTAFTVQAVPEPSTLALLGLGTAALLFVRRRK
jgi:hypothetical protein